ncbi:MAG: hypothetical protein CL842_07960 [Crocinitomicaceae bacterium]|nr:hypothetical protein [Crocinitomicaceae bacterium]|tara:strand:+ start:19079 stop:20731 length:1653 start_codon:yes stop_codon:yes gene_type:complete
MTAKLETRFLIVSLVLVAINLLGFNHLLELMAEEPRRSIIAIEMLKSGDFAIPHIYGEIYYNKPPLYNWLIAGSMALFGTGEWAARLPGILSLMATGGLLFFLCKQYFKKSTAILVALAYITSIELLFYGSTNTAEIDIFYGLITAVQVLAIFKFRQSEEYIKLFLWSYFFAAIGVMTKGIPTVAFQGLTLFGYLIATKRFKQLFSLSHLLGIGLFTIIVGGYLYYFSLHEDLLKFLSQQFQEASQRSANEAKDVNILTNMAIFIAMLLQKLLPWSLLAFFFIFKSVRGFVVQNKLLHFSLVFLASNILIYWTGADVRTRYLYPFFPFLIIVLISIIEQISLNEKSTNRFYWFFNSLVFVLPIGIIVLPYILGISNTMNLLLSIACGVSIAIIAYLNIKQREINSAMWSMVFALLIVRTFFSTVIMPELNGLNDRAHYRNTIATMIEKSEGKPVVLTGPATYTYPKISLLGNVYYSDTISYPSEVTFKVPYYYAHYTGEIMQYQTTPKSKELNYLMYESYLDRYPQKKRELFTFYNQYNKKTLVLFAVDD